METKLTWNSLAICTPKTIVKGYLQFINNPIYHPDGMPAGVDYSHLNGRIPIELFQSKTHNYKEQYEFDLERYILLQPTLNKKDIQDLFNYTLKEFLAKEIKQYISRGINCDYYKGYLDYLDFISLPNPKHKKRNSEEQVLSLREVALIHIYNGDMITTENSNQIALDFGYNSGHKLKQYYNEHYSTNDRIRNPESKRRLQSLKKTMEKVILHVNLEKKPQVRSEIEIIKKHLENL